MLKKSAFLFLALFSIVSSGISFAAEISSLGPAGSGSTDYDYVSLEITNERRVVRDVNGVLHAVFYNQDPGAITHIYYVRSENNGLSWTAPVNVATGTATNFVFSPAIAVQGTIPGVNTAVFIVYSEWNSGTNLSQQYSVVGVSTPIAGTTTLGAVNNISTQLVPFVIPNRAAPSLFDNSLFVDSSGRIHLAFSYITNTDSFIYHVLSNNGTAWNAVAPQVFNTIVGVDSDRHPRLAEDTAGVLQMVWMGNVTTYPNVGGTISSASRTPTGPLTGTWSGISTFASNNIKFPDVAYDSSNNRHLTWTEVLGGNQTVRYSMNGGSLTNISATDANIKHSHLGITTYQVPVIFFNSGSLLTNFTYFSSSKLAPTQWSTALTQSPAGRYAGSVIPVIRTDVAGNELLSSTWFVTQPVDPFSFFNRYAEDTDRIPPYQPVAPSPLLIGSGTCTADVSGATAMPAGATLVDLRLFKTVGSGPAYDVSSGFIALAAVPFIFNNVPVGATYELTVRAQDAAGNISVYSPSANLVIPANGVCVSFQVTRPPLVPVAGPTCAINNFISTDWTDNDPFDTLPTDAQNSFYIDNDNVDTNGVFQIGVGNNQPIAVASRLAGPISEDDETDSTILNLTGAPDNIYFVYGQMIGTVAGTVTSHSSVSFTKNSALNEIPQIVVTAPNAAAMAPVASIFNIQYNFTSVAMASTVALYYDPDNNPNNGNHTLIQGGILVGPAAGITAGVAVPWNTSAVLSGTYYIRAEITSNSGSGCTSIDYSGGTVQFNNPITNSFGQRIFNFPNPFSPMTANPYQSTTNIVISLDAPSDVDLYIFNTHGQTIYKRSIIGVVNNFPNFVWDGRDSHGSIVPNGVYILKALVRNTRQVYTGRMSVLDK